MSRRVSNRDAGMLERIAPYGHVTFEVCQQWRADLWQPAIGSWLKRLRKSGVLESAPLDQRRHYNPIKHKAVMFLRKRRGVRVTRNASTEAVPQTGKACVSALYFASNRLTWQTLPPESRCGSIWQNQ